MFIFLLYRLVYRPNRRRASYSRIGCYHYYEPYSIRSLVALGDVSGDGRVDSRDLELLQRHLNFGHLIQVQLDIRVADVVFDGRIDSLDLALLQRYLNFRYLIQIGLNITAIYADFFSHNFLQIKTSLSR